MQEENMSDRVKWIEEQGVKILFVDYSGLDEKKYLEVAEEFKNTVLAQPAGVIVNNIVDITNTFITEVVRNALKNFSDEIHQKRKGSEKAPTAVIGVTGVKKVIAKAFRSDVHFANDFDDAISWMVKNAQR
jgi:hypothetical protein